MKTDRGPNMGSNRELVLNPTRRFGECRIQVGSPFGYTSRTEGVSPHLTSPHPTGPVQLAFSHIPAVHPPANCHVTQITPPGRGAVSVVVVTGDSALRAVDQWFESVGRHTVEQMRDGDVSFGHWHTANNEEGVVVTRVSRSQAEVCAHGGAVAPRRVVDCLVQAGAEERDWNGHLRATTIHPFDVEATTSLMSCATRKTAGLLLDQIHGGLSQALGAVITAISEKRQASASAALDLMLERSRLGLHLTDPWRVVVAGPPNVGKSCLVNALAGYQRSIVYDEPGTTRDVLIADVVFDGWPFQLLDTAGLRDVDEPLERAGIGRAQDALAQADLILRVEDVTGSAPLDDWLENPLTNAPNLQVKNKADLRPPELLATDGSSVGSSLHGTRAWLTSAVTGDGLPELITTIVNTLIPDRNDNLDGMLFTDRQVQLVRQASDAIHAGQPQNAIGLLKQIAPIPQGAEGARFG